MRLQMSRGSLRCILLTCTFSLLLGLMSLPAYANEPPFPCDNDHRENDGRTWTDEWGFTWECAPDSQGNMGWVLRPFGGGKTKSQRFTTSNPSSKQIVSAALRAGSGGGLYEGGQQIFDGSGRAISRPMRTRIVAKYWHPTGGWLTCHDSGWINNGTRHWSHNGLNMGASPDCGGATYGMKTAAIYWSATTNRWLGGTWVLSGNIGLPANCCAQVTEPMGDDPLNLPPAP